MTKSKSPKSKQAPTKPKPPIIAPPGAIVRAPQPSGPTLIPPTDGTCATCFYGRMTIDIGGPTPARVCRANAPSALSPQTLAPQAWPVVSDDDWCADGVDATTYGSFAPDWY